MELTDGYTKQLWIADTPPSGYRPTSVIYDEYINKEYKLPRDNNCKENHERGLEKRIANFNTMHTIRTMDNSPAQQEFQRKARFYANVMLMLQGIKPKVFA